MPYSSEVVSFESEVTAGYGQSDFPDERRGGALEVHSLGIGGEIVLGFGGRKVVDIDGPDFVIIEHPFAIGGDTTNPLAELHEYRLVRTARIETLSTVRTRKIPLGMAVLVGKLVDCSITMWGT